jgi:hypothetical protein
MAGEETKKVEQGATNPAEQKKPQDAKKKKNEKEKEEELVSAIPLISTVIVAFVC